jgi:peptide/nickel transport system substrate-binding protein
MTVGMASRQEATMQVETTQESVLDPQPRRLWRKELRQAVAAAIDREAIVDEVLGGHGTAAYHMVPPGYPFTSEPFRELYGRRNLELSIRLLSELGYSRETPFELDLWHPPAGHYGARDEAMIELLKAQLEESGLIKVHLHSKPWGAYVDSLLASEMPAFVIGWSPDFVDPDNWLSPFASSAQSPDQGVHYHDAEMNRLLQTAASSTDPAERGRLYQQIGLRFAENVPTLPLWWDPAIIAYRDGVEGITIGPPFELNYHIVSFGPGSRPAAGNTETLIIGKTFAVQSLDANDAHARSDWEILKNTGESLVSYKPGTAELILGAAALPTISDGGRTYTFKLREGLKFADGTALTAENYLYAWRRLNVLKGQVSGLVRIYVEAVEAPDDLTVVYHLRDRFGFFPAVAASPCFIPVHPRDFPADRVNRFPEKLDGIGRYRMISYVPGDRMILESNPYCALDGPKIPRVVLRYFASVAELASALVAGEIDVAWRKLDTAQAARLREQPGLKVVTVSTPLLRYLVFNNAYPA